MINVQQKLIAFDRFFDCFVRHEGVVNLRLLSARAMALLSKKTLSAAIVSSSMVLSGCSTIGGLLNPFDDGGTPPPSQFANACKILDEREAWQEPVFEAAHKWGVSPGTILSFMRQESSFRHDARPLDGQGRPRSSALGYSQALDGTWRDYEQVNGRGDRTDFADAADFIGWYLNVINRVVGVSRDNVRDLYLAYHDGPGGFQRGTWRSKGWLIDVAGRVESIALTYDEQLTGCHPREMRQFARERNDRSLIARLWPF